MAIPVLVIEDDAFLAHAYEMRFKQEPDFQARIERDGVRAVEAAVEHQAAVILLDIVMPKKDGVAVLRDLRSDPRTQDIPVLVVTNSGDPAVREACLAMQKTQFFVKSETSIHALSDTIRRVTAEEKA